MSTTLKESWSAEDENPMVQEYKDALEAVRVALAGDGDYPRTLPAETTKPQVVTVDLSGGGERDYIAPAKLIYHRPSAYIYGYIGSDGEAVRFGGEDAEKALPDVVKTLGFKPDYGSMSWQKNNDSLTVKLDQVIASLWGLAEGGAVEKGDMVNILVGFAEAARFRDIERAVISGAPFGGKALKWSGVRQPGDLLLKKAQS